MKKKLNLDQLKVKSFVTSMEEKTEETVKGGSAVCSVVCSAACLPNSGFHIAACVETNVDAICKGWHTAMFWQGCQ